MENRHINELYDQISKVIKNDQKYPYKKMGELIVASANRFKNIEYYYAKYPPLLDVVELSASLEYEGSAHHDEMVRQIKYKMNELMNLLPDTY
ncbi:MAG: hypothetical protein JWO55_89 [Candidatus Saccharibacteria bacterium]|jgi:hypothetical protein|nr:hypothetical protein [Candidatus Saccharibacteria bacterium]